jgi:hypothetical protein
LAARADLHDVDDALIAIDCEDDPQPTDSRASMPATAL